MTLSPGSCAPATNTYVLSGTLAATNVPTSGTLVISSGAFSPRSLTLPVGNATGTFSYSGLVSNGQTYTVTASFSNSACSPVSQIYTAPVSCSVAPVCSLSATATAGVCATATNTYSATVAIGLTNALAGTLTVSIPGSAPISQAIAANTGSFTAVFAGLPSDGASHMATITLPGCGTTTATYAAPASCSVAPMCSLSAIATAGLCQTATNTFTNTVVVRLTNPTTGVLTVSDGPASLTFATTAVSSATYTATFNNIVSNGSLHTVTANLPGCSSTTTTYTAPASCSTAPICSVGTPVVTAGACASATNTYSATALVTIQNPASGGTLTISNGTTSQPFSTTAGSSNTFTMVFNGLVSSGLPRTITATLPGCGSATAQYTAPASCSAVPVCVINSPVVTAGGCASATNTYSTTAVVTLINPPAGVLTVTDGPRSLTSTIISGLGSFTFTATFNGLTSDASTHTITANLPGCSSQSVNYTAPASCSVAPACSVSAITTRSLCATATNTFSNTVLVTLTNPTAGTLTVTDGPASLTFAVPTLVGTATVSAIFNGLLSNGATRTVIASLPGCSATPITYTAPASCSGAAPACSVGTPVITVGSCATATNTYSTTAAVTLANTTAGVLTVSNGATSLTTTVAGGLSSFTYTATFNGLPSDGASRTITASLPGCGSATASYTAPISCTPTLVCQVQTPTVTVGPCLTATNTYSTTAVVVLQNPAGGQILSISNGITSQVVATTAGTSNTFTATFIGVPSDGLTRTITATLPGCGSATAQYTAPASCGSTTTCPPFTLSPASLPNGTVGMPYNVTLVASGGTGPYSYSVTLGTLPAGLALSPAGIISGTPSATGSFGITVRVSDNAGCFQELDPGILTIGTSVNCPPARCVPLVIQRLR
ncbi:hypothetical protein [Spirosoma areae]